MQSQQHAAAFLFSLSFLLYTSYFFKAPDHPSSLFSPSSFSKKCDIITVRKTAKFSFVFPCRATVQLKTSLDV